MSDALAELFSSKVRAAVLAHLLPRPHLGFGLTDLSRELGLPISSLQHEFYKLSRIGVLRDARDGAVRRYRPNPGFHLLEPLTAMVLRDLDLAAGLRAAAGGVGGLDLAFATAPTNPGVPPSIAIVGLLEVEALDALLVRAVAVYAAHGRPTPELAYFPPAEWQARVRAGNPLVRSLLESPRIALSGEPGDG